MKTCLIQKIILILALSVSYVHGEGNLFFNPQNTFSLKYQESPENNWIYKKQNSIILLAQNRNTAANIRRKSRAKRREVSNVLHPQYESCKDVDISSMASEREDLEDAQSEFCFDCSFQELSGFGELKKAGDALQSKVFMEKLQKRVISQIESKIYQTKVLRACATRDRNWLSKQKVDWSLMKAVCKQKNNQLKSSIQTRWTKMKVNLALSQVNADQIVTSRPDLSFQFSHQISGFSPIPKLTEKEKKVTAHPLFT